MIKEDGVFAQEDEYRDTDMVGVRLVGTSEEEKGVEGGIKARVDGVLESI